jgi:proline iminopeptidase
MEVYVRGRFSLKSLAFSSKIVILLAVFWPSTLRSASQEKRETALDRIVHIEKKLITEIPAVPRWCDRLDLIKRRIDVGGCELYVEEEGKGQALILINGGPGGTHHYFHPWFSRAKGYARVIYYDQRGCGLSDFKPGQGYTVDQAVDDLEKLRQASNAGKWVLLGYSYGGFLAQYYATKYPDNTAGLILMSATPGVSVGNPPPGQFDFISSEERARRRELPAEVQKWADENKIPDERAYQVLQYNVLLNGDWKYQNLYKPSPERMIQEALYEWTNDKDFNQALNSSLGKIDLAGAFSSCPIPTLILEGKHDLTWSADKREILHDNHPGSGMVLFEHASHPIYEEEPDMFFSVIEKFIRGLPNVSPSAAQAYKNYLAQREKELKSSFDHILDIYGWGRSSNEKLAKSYSREWLTRFKSSNSFLQVGFALYDVGNYGEALIVFERMRDFARKQPNRGDEAMALIWQGHMLDLMGKRADAAERYKKAADMNITGSYQHDQFGLRYSLSPYAAERIKEPFHRIENRLKD